MLHAANHVSQPMPVSLLKSCLFSDRNLCCGHWCFVFGGVSGAIRHPIWGHLGVHTGSTTIPCGLPPCYIRYATIQQTSASISPVPSCIRLYSKPLALRTEGVQTAAAVVWDGMLRCVLGIHTWDLFSQIISTTVIHVFQDSCCRWDLQACLLLLLFVLTV